MKVRSGKPGKVQILGVVFASLFIMILQTHVAQAQQGGGDKEPHCKLKCFVAYAADIAAADAFLNQSVSAYKACKDEAAQNLSSAISRCEKQWQNNQNQRNQCIQQAKDTNQSALKGCETTYSTKKTQYDQMISDADADLEACLNACPKRKPIGNTPKPKPADTKDPKDDEAPLGFSWEEREQNREELYDLVDEIESILNSSVY